MKRFLSAMALAGVLSVSALAGDIPTVPGPPPPPQGITATPTSAGDIAPGGAAEQISDAALSAFMTLLGFLTV